MKEKKCCDKPKGRKNLPLTVFPSYQFGYYSCSKRPVCTNEMCDFVIPTLYFLEPSLVVFLSAKILWSGGFPPQMKTVFGLFLLSSLVVFPPLPLMSLLWCGLTSNEILHRYGHMHTVDLCWTALSFPLSHSYLLLTLSLSHSCFTLGPKGTFRA